MKKMSIAFFAILLAVCSIAYAANNFRHMTKEEVMQALNDKTITTIPLARLNDKLVTNSFTGYFGPNGQSMGKFANQPDNNIQQGSTGTWNVKNDGSVCITWKNWSNDQENCVYLYNAKNSLVITSLDGTFQTLILNDQIQSGNQLSGSMTNTLAPTTSAPVNNNAPMTNDNSSTSGSQTNGSTPSDTSSPITQSTTPMNQ